MYLTLVAIATYIQAVMAVVAVIITFVVWSQNRKIKNLTHVVEKLDSQNQLTATLVTAFVKSNVKNYSPFFILQSHGYANEEKKMNLELFNDGVSAFDIKIEPRENKSFKIVSARGHCQSSLLYQIILEFLQVTGKEQHLDFTIHYNSKFGRGNQRVFINDEHNLIVEFPNELREV